LLFDDVTNLGFRFDAEKTRNENRSYDSIQVKIQVVFIIHHSISDILQTNFVAEKVVLALETS
jgi:hypothetical protein